MRSEAGRHCPPPYIMQRFFTINVENEPLRYEASVAIEEGRIHEGDDMYSQRINDADVEEGTSKSESSSTNGEQGSESTSVQSTLDHTSSRSSSYSE